MSFDKNENKDKLLNKIQEMENEIINFDIANEQDWFERCEDQREVKTTLLNILEDIQELILEGE